MSTPSTATASGPAHDLPPPAPGVPRRTVLIASTPRTGSTLLGDALQGTGHCGVPQEYLNPRQLRAFGQRLGPVPLPTYLGWLRERRASANGVFAIKAHHQQLAAAGLHDAARLRALLGPLDVVFVHREDVARQAVSYSRAAQTQRWQATDTALAPARYDLAHMLGALRDIWQQNQRWAQLFAALGLRPHTVRYRDLATDYAGTVAATVRALRLGPGALAAIPPPPQARMPSPEREAWARRFRQDALKQGISPQFLGPSESAPAQPDRPAAHQSRATDDP